MALPPAAALIPVRPGGEILLMLRDDRPDLPNANRWSTVGGAVEAGETPDQAARRECDEELGQRPDGLVPLGTVDGTRFRSHLFATRVTWSLDDLVLGEGQGVDWLGREAILAAPLALGVGPGIVRFLESETYRVLAGGPSPGPALRLPPFPPALSAALGLRAGQLVAVDGASAAFVRRLWDVLGGARVTASPAAGERLDILLWWPRPARAEAQLAAWRARMAPGGAIWVVVDERAGEDAVRRLIARAESLGLTEQEGLTLPTGEPAFQLRDARECRPG